MNDRFWEQEYTDDEVLEILKAQREWTVMYADGYLLQMSAGVISGTGEVRKFGKQIHFESDREAIIYGARELIELGVLAPPVRKNGSDD